MNEHQTPQRLTERAQLYSRSNLPPSLEAADRRLEELELIIEGIAAKIEFSDPKRFGSQSEYDGWHARALKALIHFRAERTFIMRWLSSQRHVPEGMTSMDPELRAVDVREEVRQRLAMAELTYEPLYSMENSPPNDVAVVRRRVELNLIMDMIERAQQTVKEFALGLGMGSDEWSVYSRPFHARVRAVKAEQRYLRDLETVGPRTRPVSILLRIIDHAVLGGFQLSPEDRELHDAIISPVKL